VCENEVERTERITILVDWRIPGVIYCKSGECLVLRDFRIPEKFYLVDVKISPVNIIAAVIQQ
jgi:hypothetical protein